MKNQYTHKIDDDFNLAMEFAKLGFEYKNLLHTIRYVNDWTIVLTAQTVFKFTRNRLDKIYFLFTVIQLGSLHEYVIYHIQATSVTSLLYSSRTTMIVTKDYWITDNPLPTKENICEDIRSVLKADTAHENRWTYENQLSKFFIHDQFSDGHELN